MGARGKRRTSEKVFAVGLESLWKRNVCKREGDRRFAESTLNEYGLKGCLNSLNTDDLRARNSFLWGTGSRFLGKRAGKCLRLFLKLTIGSWDR